MGGILQQESHYEISCLFRWADQLPTVTYSPSPVERSSRMPNASLFIFIFYLLHGFYVLNMYWFRNFTHSPPRFFARTPYVSTLILYARYYSAFTSVRLPQLHPHSGHIPYPHNHSIHYTIHSFSFTDTLTIAPLSTPSPSTPTSNSHINHGIPIPVINNESQQANTALWTIVQVRRRGS